MNDGLVCCAVGERQYALRGADVRQIVRAETMRDVGGADGRAGTLEFAGRRVPVFPLGGVLGRTAGAGSMSRGHHIAVTGEDATLVGWLVDRIVRAPLGAAAVLSALPDFVGATACRWFEALVADGERSVLLLSPASLNPLAPASGRRTAAIPITTPSCQPGDAGGERVVLLFSSPAFPSSPISRFALSARQIAAITEPLDVVEVPGAAPHIAGVGRWRDTVVPVIDVRDGARRHDGAQRRRYVVAQCSARLHGSLVAFAVEADIRMHRAGGGDRRIDGVACPAFARGVFDIAGETVALVDLDALAAPAADAAPEESAKEES